MKHISILSIFAVLLGISVQAQDTVSIISFNIRNSSAVAEDGPHAWQYRKEAVVRMIRQEAPDIVGLQEALPDQVAYLDSALADTYSRYGVPRDDGKEKGEMMAVYYKSNRYGTIYTNTIWLSPTPQTPSVGWDGACKRTASIVILKNLKSGHLFTYVNTHLDHVGKEARAEGLKLIANSTAKNLATPVFVGGDFNTSMRDAIYSNLYQSGFKAARSDAPVTDNKMTYTGYGKSTPSTIDHIFYRKATPVSFQTLDANYGVPYISDHYPVKAIFVTK